MRSSPAPSARRTAISRPRAVARVSTRCATLAHAISNVRPTAPRRISSGRRTPPSTWSASGCSSTATSAFVSGCSFASALEIAAASARAEASGTSGLRRSTTPKMRSARFRSWSGFRDMAAPIVDQTSNRRSGYSNAGGMTPTIVYGRSASSMVLPSTSGLPGITALPEGVRDHGQRLSVLLRLEGAPQRGPAEQGEEALRDDRAQHRLRVRAEAHVVPVRRPAGRVLERAAARHQVLEIGDRSPGHHEAVDRGMGQGAEQDRVDHAEERDVGADAQGQRGHGDEGERGAGAESPQRETEILPEGVHSPPPVALG